MSARTFSTLTVLSLAAIPFVACGGDDGNGKTDSGIVVHDSNGSGSGSGSGSGNVCSVMASYSPTFDTSNSETVNGGNDQSPFTQHNYFLGVLGPDLQNDPVLQIDVFGGAGSAMSPDWPTNLGAKSGIDISMAKDAGALIQANFGSDGSPQDLYFATAGTLNVTSASNTTGGTFSGTLANATFVHVDLGSNSATVDPDGCMTTIANLSFTGATMAPQFTGKTLVHAALFHRYH